jgi:hypothetical protein
VARPTAKGGAETPNDFVPVSAETAERRQAFKEILPPSHKQSGEPSFQSQTKAKAANERHVEASAAAHVNAPRPGTPRKPRTARALRITARSEHATRIRRTRLPSSFRDAPHVLALLAAEVYAQRRSGHTLSVGAAAQRTRLTPTFVRFDRLLGAHRGMATVYSQLDCLGNLERRIRQRAKTFWQFAAGRRTDSETTCYPPLVPLPRTCTVSIRDSDGITHNVQVEGSSLFEAAARLRSPPSVSRSGRRRH